MDGVEPFQKTNMGAPGPDDSNWDEPAAMNAAEKSIIVNAPVAEVYERWLRFEELPKFIKSLGNVERIDDTHFSFSNRRDGKEQRGVIEIIRQIPERTVAWRTIADGVGLGVVA